MHNIQKVNNAQRLQLQQQQQQHKWRNAKQQKPQQQENISPKWQHVLPQVVLLLQVVLRQLVVAHLLQKKQKMKQAADVDSEN